MPITATQIGVNAATRFMSSIPVIGSLFSVTLPILLNNQPSPYELLERDIQVMIDSYRPGFYAEYLRFRNALRQAALKALQKKSYLAWLDSKIVAWRGITSTLMPRFYIKNENKFFTLSEIILYRSNIANNIKIVPSSLPLGGLLPGNTWTYLDHNGEPPIGIKIRIISLLVSGYKPYQETILAQIASLYPSLISTMEKERSYFLK